MEQVEEIATQMNAVTVCKSWKKPTIILCLFGFFTTLKPSEPYLVPYLMSPRLNFTETEVVNQIFPVWIYSYFALLCPVFLLTDILRYKPVVIAEALGFIACWIILVFGHGVPLFQLMEFFYAVGTAGQVAYFSYIYSVVEPDKYQRCTSYVRTAIPVGYFLGSLTAQLLVSFADIDYWYLNIISLASVSIGFVVACFLPMPAKSMFFSEYVTTDISGGDADRTSSQPTIDLITESTFSELQTSFNKQEQQAVMTTVAQWKRVMKCMWKQIKLSYGDTDLLRWSVWWSLSTCGWLLVNNYVQSLWESLNQSGEDSTLYNGAVFSAATVLGAFASLSVGWLKVNWAAIGELALGICSLAIGGLLILMYLTTDIWICYIAYVLFSLIYEFIITVTQFQLAIVLKSTSIFALIFGVNTFMALLLNSLLTLVLIDQAGLGLPVDVQFVIYGGYFGVISIVFLSHGAYQLRMDLRKNQEEENRFPNCAKIEKIDRL